MTTWAEVNVPGYKVERLIAEGGMASVYLAVQEKLGRPVALKILRKVDNPAESERFLNEGRIIASLNHRNIITIYDVGVAGERPYLSMEYLEGGDLEQKIAEGLSAEEALRLVETLGACLDFVNREGIVHRDIKPANILFHQDGTPILTDFGIAKDLGTETRLTREGAAIGSPCYLSPEQAECRTLDGRADIYGLGVILYEMLTGRKPYQGESYIETIMAHLTEPVPCLPPELRRYQDLIDRMLAKDRDERFSTAGELSAYVHELRRAEPAEQPSLLHRISKTGWLPNGTKQPSAVARIGIRKIHRLPRPSYRLGLGLAGAMVVLLAGATLYQRGERPAETEPQTALKPTEPTTTPETAGIGQAQATEVTPVAVKTADSSFWVLQDADGEPALRVESASAATTSPAGLEPEAAAGDDLKIEEHLLSARDALENYRLLIPEQHSAYYHYQEVLKRNPRHREALQGLQEIAEKYADLVEKELDQFHYRAAKKYLRRGLRVQPENPRLLALSEQTEVIKDGPKRLVGKIKSLFE